MLSSTQKNSEFFDDPALLASPEVIDGLERAGAEAQEPREDIATVAAAAEAYVDFKPAAAISTINGAAGTDPRLRESHLRVLLVVIWNTYGQTGMCWLTIEQIAALTGLASKTVSNCLTDLAAYGYLARTDGRRSNATGRNRTADIALRPAGFSSWEALRSEIDAWVRVVRQGGNATRPTPDNSPSQGNTDQSVETNVPQRGMFNCSEFPQRGMFNSGNVPQPGKYDEPVSIYFTTDANSTIDPSFTTGTGESATVVASTPEPVIETVVPEIIETGRAGKKAPASPREPRGERFDEQKHVLPIKDEWRAAAVDIGLSEDQARAAYEKFRDYWRGVAGAKGRKLDWLATWRNWCRTENKPRGAGGAPGSTRVTF